MATSEDRDRERKLRAAEGYIALNMPDHALRSLKQIEANEFRKVLLKGEALRIKNDFVQALEAFRRAHLEKPTDLSALMGMAWCFKRIDQLPQAIDAMKLAYEFHKNVAVVLYNLACYYSLAGEKESALSWLGRSLRMDRDLLGLIPEEADFDPLRGDRDFQHLLELSSGQTRKSSET